MPQPDATRDTLDVVTRGLVLSDSDGLVVSANAAALRLLGVELLELQGQPADDPRWSLVDPRRQPLPPGEHPVQRVLRTGGPVRGMVIGVFRPTPDGDGTYIWLVVDCEPLFRDEAGHPHAVVASFREVGARTRSHLQLRESESRYRLLADNSSDVIARTSVNGLVRWVSPAVKRVLGYAPQSLVGSRVAGFVHPEDLPGLVKALATLTDPESPDLQVVDARLRKRGGDFVPVEVALHAIRGSDGLLTEIQSSTRDASVRVQAEVTRRAGEDVFRLALENARMGMAVLDVDGRWVTVNSSLALITGYEHEAMSNVPLLELVHPDDRDEVAADHRALLAGEESSTEAEVRLLTGAGDTVWVELSTTVASREGTGPTYLVVQVVDISRRKRAQETLARRAVTDPLTGLPNRVVLHDRLEHALARCRRDGGQVGLVFIDLDHLKNLNDVFGHDAGDEVLRELARRLSAVVREADTAVRLGGDEFVVLCEEDVDLPALEALAARLMAELGRPYALGWGEASVTCSVGLTLGSGPDATTLIHEADTAMYRAKQRGRARISVYDRAVQAEAMHDLAVESELEQALAGDELRIHYQSIVRLADGVVVAREALVRWEHPDRGLLDPAMFIPAVEQSPLITKVGRWTLAQACRDAVGWADFATVCVNISPRHLAQADFPDSVQKVLHDSGLAPERLQIEITESSILHTSTSTLRSTAGLTELGVTLALDDFGTGYSSITALHRLPISTLKIDRSFVQGLPDDAEARGLVHGLVRMAEGLGLEVVAEGVETAEQADWLRAHGCPLAQGFHLGRPQP